jgi:hypothetical protein
MLLILAFIMSTFGVWCWEFFRNAYSYVSGMRTQGDMRRHVSGYGKTSYGACKIEKKNLLLRGEH